MILTKTEMGDQKKNLGCFVFIEFSFSLNSGPSKWGVGVEWAEWGNSLFCHQLSPVQVTVLKNIMYPCFVLPIKEAKGRWVVEMLKKMKEHRCSQHLYHLYLSSRVTLTIRAPGGHRQAVGFRAKNEKPRGHDPNIWRLWVWLLEQFIDVQISVNFRVHALY